MTKRVVLRVMAFLVLCATMAACPFIYRVILGAIGGDVDHWTMETARHRFAAFFLTMPLIVAGFWPAVREIDKSINLKVYGNEQGKQGKSGGGG